MEEEYMDENGKGKEKPALSNIVDSDAERRGLAAPTLMAAFGAGRAGAIVESASPGRVLVSLPHPEERRCVSIRVTRENPFASEVRCYELVGQPVPQDVIENMERWEREHGGGR
jgi:hypothetical protein